MQSAHTDGKGADGAQDGQQGASGAEEDRAVEIAA